MTHCHLYTSNCNIEYSFTVLFILVSFILLSGAFTSMIVAFYCPMLIRKTDDNESFKRMPIKYFQVTSIGSMLFGIGCIICDLIHVVEGWAIPIDLRNDYFKPLRTAANVFAFQSYILTDLVILGRLYYSFSASAYRLSSYLLGFISLLLITIEICDVLYLILLLSDWSVLVHYKKDILLLFVICELSVSISMSLIFSKKLHQVLRADDDQSNTVRNNIQLTPKNKKIKVSVNDDMNIDKSIDLNTMQIKLLNLSAKNTIICAIAALYFGFRFGYRQFAVRYDVEQNIEPIWMISYVSRTFVFVTNAIAVYFGFAFSTQSYYKIFAKCHICVYKLCSKVAKREIKNNVLQSIQYEIVMDLSLKQTASKQHHVKQETMSLA